MTPDEMARHIAAAIQSRECEPAATRQLRAAGEELSVLEPLSRAVYACKSWEVQLRLCDEIKDALLRAIAHVEEAKQIIERDPAIAFAPSPVPGPSPAQ